MRPFNVEKMIEFFFRILPYIGVTFEYVIASLFFGTIIAFFVAKAKLGKNKIIKSIAYGYTTVMRCVPSIVLLFLTYYGVPFFFRSTFGIMLSGENKLAYVIVTFTLFIGSSMSEIMRSAYESVEKGQYEAGVSIGLTKFQVYTRIVFPQALRVAIPNIGNMVIYLLKEGALAFTIGLVDVMGKGTKIKSTNLGYAFEIYVALTCIYWPISIILEKIFQKIDDSLNTDKKYKFIKSLRVERSR